MKAFVKVLKSIGNTIMFLLGGNGDICTEAEAEGIISFDGQR